MTTRSMSNSHGNSFANGPDMRAGSPVPKYMQAPAFLDARVMSTTSWDFQ